MKRSNQKQQGTSHPLAALGSFFSGSKNNSGPGPNSRDDLGSDGMSGSGSASGSSGVNNSSSRNGMRNMLNSNNGLMSNQTSSMIQNNMAEGDVCTANDNLVVPLAAVHAAMASATLDRQFHSSWRHQQQQMNANNLAMPSFGRPFVRNNSLGHAILPSQSQNTIPFAIDPKYDSDSDFDYRQRPPRYFLLGNFIYIRLELRFKDVCFITT